MEDKLTTPPMNSASEVECLQEFEMPGEVLSNPNFDSSGYQILSNSCLPMDRHETIRFMRSRGFSLFPLKALQETPDYDWRLAKRAIVNDNVLRSGRLNLGVVTGNASGNLVVINCLDETTFQGFLVILGEKYASWIVKSPQGGQIWFLLSEGQLEDFHSCPDDNYGNFEVLGRDGYVIIPPSTNGQGEIYHWEERDGDYPPKVSPSVLRQFIPELRIYGTNKNELPDLVKRVLFEEDISGLSSWRIALLSSVRALAEMDWEEPEVLSFLQEKCPRSVLKVIDNPDGSLAQFIVRPVFADLFPEEEQVEKLTNAVLNMKWQERRGAYDRMVVLALLKRAKRDGLDNIRASVRELVEFTGMTKPTVLKSLANLRQRGLLRCVSEDRLNGFRYQLMLEGLSLTTINDNPNGQTLPFTHDAFTFSGLGVTGCQILHYLLALSSNDVDDRTNAAIERHTGRSAKCVRSRLKQLQQVGLVNKQGRLWFAANLSRDELDEGLKNIAEVAGVSGSLVKKRIANQRDRDQWISKKVQEQIERPSAKRDV